MIAKYGVLLWIGMCIAWFAEPGFAVEAKGLYCPGIHLDRYAYKKKTFTRLWIKRHALQRMLVVGNSLTRHLPESDIGWNYYWGMAASTPDKDWAHWVRLLAAIDQDRPMDIQAVNTDLPWIDRDFSTLQATLDSFKPDVVFIQVGDNATDTTETGFKTPYIKLLDLVRRYTTRLYLLGTWRLGYYAPFVDDFIKELALNYDAKYIPISQLFGQLANQAQSEALCAGNQTINPNVCWHPGDTGMRAIADTVCK